MSERLKKPWTYEEWNYMQHLDATWDRITTRLAKEWCYYSSTGEKIKYRASFSNTDTFGQGMILSCLKWDKFSQTQPLSYMLFELFKTKLAEWYFGKNYGDKPVKEDEALIEIDRLLEKNDPLTFKRGSMLKTHNEPIKKNIIKL